MVARGPNMVDLMKDIITRVIEREVDPKHPDAITDYPNDPGGRTQYGISERANPAAWKDGHVTEDEARDIYYQKYVVAPGFHKIPPGYEGVQEQLIDFGVHSGAKMAIRKLQEALSVEIDGILG